MSRRKCFSLFCDGKVSVNNVICKDFKSICQTGDLITRSDQGHHAITINNNSEKEQIEGDIIIFYKPTGYVVSRNDHFNDTIYSLLPPEYALHYRPVGRLDKDTSGLLLLTNNGSITHRLMHPKHHIHKKYIATLDHPLTKKDKDRMIRGESVGMFDPQDTHRDYLSFHDIYTEKSGTAVITLISGKKRHIRRLFRHMGYRILSLHRLSFGSIHLDIATPGSYRSLSKVEVQNLLYS